MKIYNEKILILVENKSKKINIYNIKKDKIQKQKKLKGHVSPIISALLLNSYTLVSADQRKIKIWNLRTKKVIKNLPSTYNIKFLK